MDPVRFDRWTRGLVAAPHARRRLLAALAGGLVAGSILGTPPTAQAKHHHKKPCTGGATPCGKGCCAADDHCVQGTCYCAASDGAATRAAAACTPWPGCASHRDIDGPCGAGVLGPCLCQRSLDATLACVTLDAPVCDCAHDADCRDGYVCVAGVEGCGGGNACVPTGDPFCLPGGAI
jgi:hypothetical protein